ncbi:MAG: RNA-binding S4 domain-containing protein [Alistipes sp.]|jgi:ribosome-associated heat shock protein Hsp15|nr:RNA-binding S4 domain-containing protein [Alistipes sp.]
MGESIRLDKYLWAVRIFKTRSEAADAIRNNRVTVNGAYAKPSREVKVGDTISLRRTIINYTYEVVALVSNRQPAKNVPLYCKNTTPQSELDRLNMPRETIFVFRERGTGRPTKKERREIDEMMEGIFLDDDLPFDDDDE